MHYSGAGQDDTVTQGKRFTNAQQAGELMPHVPIQGADQWLCPPVSASAASTGLPLLFIAVMGKLSAVEPLAVH